MSSFHQVAAAGTYVRGLYTINYYCYIRASPIRARVNRSDEFIVCSTVYSV